MKSLAIFVLGIFLLCSCGKKSSSPNRKETRIQEDEISEVLENQHFKCAALAGECPAGLARLLILDPIDPDKSSVCTGFVIDGNKLITNNHCVPNESICKNTYLAIYDGYGHQINKCLNIIKTLEDFEDPNDPRRKLDFTVMKMEKSFRGSIFQLAQEEAVPGDVIHAWVIDHTGLDLIRPNLTQSRITELECEVQDQDEAASLVMINCPIISGNSGSPALNEEGKVVGVVWGGTANVDSTYELELRRELDALGLVTESRFFSNYVINSN